MAVGYLAARYSRIDELNGYRKQLEDRGHRIPARWLRGEHRIEGLSDEQSAPLEMAVGFANDDMEDILCSDFMIAFTEEPRTGPTRGGRHVETGIMLGLKAASGRVGGAPKLYIVGPLENVFHALPEIDGRYPDFRHLLDDLDAGLISLHWHQRAS